MEKKGRKIFLRRFGGDAGTVVGDGDADSVVAGAAGDADSDDAALGESVDGIADEVGEYLAEFSVASPDEGGADELCFEMDGSLFHQGLMQLEDAVDQGRHVDLYGIGGVAIEGQGSAGDLAEAQDFVEQEFGVAAGFLVERGIADRR